MATGQFEIQKTSKNKELERKYGLFHDEKKRILQSLLSTDCVGVEPNNNPRYPEAEVFIFIKDSKVNLYGKEEYMRLYIKMYLREFKTRDLVVVISFHEEGNY